MLSEASDNFAYGSNLSLDQMAHRCPDAIPIGTGKIDGYELLFRGSRTGSYLTIEPKNDSCVPVLVWEITDTDRQMLDRYEGYPVFYQIEEFEIEVTPLEGGEPCMQKGFAYVMDQTHPLGRPSDWYYEVCRQGYQRFGFDEAILEKALRRSTAHQKSVLEGFTLFENKRSKRH